MRLNTSALIVCCLVLAACSGAAPGSPDGGGDCRTSSCPTNYACSNVTHVCTPICPDIACTAGLVCEDGSCVAPGCGGDADCTAGQVCQSGNCVTAPAASAVLKCDIAPPVAVIHAGKTLQLHALVQDSTSTVVPFAGVTWAPAGTVSSSGLVTAPASAGTVTVTATAGSKTCTSTLTVYGAAAVGTQRVVVINALTKQPIQGAFVVQPQLAGASIKVTTDASGSASFTSTGAHDFHVLAKGFNYVTLLQATGTDMLVPLTPVVPGATRNYFAGDMPSTAFTNLTEQNQIIHLAFFGSSISNSLLDLSVDTLLGGVTRPTVNINLTGTPIPLDGLPYGLVLGVGTNMFGTDAYRIYSDAGIRTLWGIGGNVNFDKVLAAITPLIGTNNPMIDPGTLLPQLLPLLGKLEAGAISAQQTPGSQGVPVTVPLNTPLRLRAQATVPTLPQVDGHYVDGAIALVGAGAYPMGFVPLGLTAGLAGTDASGTPNGTVQDPNCTPTSATDKHTCATSKLLINYAPENGGTEGNPYGYLLVALNFGGLTGSTMGNVSVSGLVNTMQTASYVPPTATPPAITYGSFLNLPASNTLAGSQGGRTLTISGDADHSAHPPQIYRVEVENAARVSWQVWTPPVGTGTGARVITLPSLASVDASLTDDPFGTVPNAKGVQTAPTGRITALRITGGTQDYGTLTSFGSLTLDELGNTVDAFSLTTFPIGN